MLVRPTPPKSTPTRIRLRPQDPFDLIRLLARSQSDPRKALAELVQNSLDAGARRIDIHWFNEKGKRALRIWDDGEGIFPALERREALERIARTIGHSHKRALSPAERREQMVLGKYGIGLIGFWSVGHEMEIKSRVGGDETWSLKLVDDDPRGEVQRSRTRRTDEEPTYTEITIRGVHAAAARQVRPPRLQAFLASELRGQLLERGAEVRIHDHVARGRATKEFRVQAQPYLGTPLTAFDTLPVEGFEDARIELYLVSQDEDRIGRVALACGGTTVLDDLSWIEGPELPRTPWSSGRLEGVVDFPELEVALGSRRGFAPNAASEAFIAALARLERDLAIQLARDEERRAEESQRNLAREIRKAFLPIAARLPEYDLFEVRAGPKPDTGPPNGADEGAQLGEGPLSRRDPCRARTRARPRSARARRRPPLPPGPARLAAHRPLPAPPPPARPAHPARPGPGRRRPPHLRPRPLRMAAPRPRRDPPRRRPLPLPRPTRRGPCHPGRNRPSSRRERDRPSRAPHHPHPRRPREGERHPRTPPDPRAGRTLAVARPRGSLGIQHRPPGLPRGRREPVAAATVHGAPVREGDSSCATSAGRSRCSSGWCRS